MAVFVGRLSAAGAARRDRDSVDGSGMVNEAQGSMVWKTGHSRGVDVPGNICLIHH